MAPLGLALYCLLIWWGSTRRRFSLDVWGILLAGDLALTLSGWLLRRAALQPLPTGARLIGALLMSFIIKLIIFAAMFGIGVIAARLFLRRKERDDYPPGAD